MARRILFFSIGISFFLMACGSSNSFDTDDVLRTAVDTPVEFEPMEGLELLENSCISPLFDPRDDTRITISRSSGTVADYEVPDGKYGVGPNELLRVNCRTGEVVGVVKK